MNLGKVIFRQMVKSKITYNIFLIMSLLQGEFVHSSDFLDLDELLSEDDLSVEHTDSLNENISDTISLSTDIINIPENIHFTFHSSIKHLKYDSLPIHLFRGDVVVHNGKLDFNELKMNVFDYQIYMEGNYEAISNKNAKASLNLKLIDFSFDEAYIISIR